LTKSNKKEVEFEEALDRLENIITMLNDGSLSIDESLKLFEEGIKLVRICQDKLSNVENKISLLLADKNGNLNEIPFNIESEE